MFTGFFYLLRARGLSVSLNEWMVLLEALVKGLHGNSFTGFYHLCRAVIVHSEVDFDRFDQIFLEYFQDVPYVGELPEEVMEWLNRPVSSFREDMEELRRIGASEESIEDLLRMLQERLSEQTEAHHGGDFWIGTEGTSPFGHGGRHPRGMRIGGQSGARSAMVVAGDRIYRDFRKDKVLDVRQFQMAFRILRQYSVQDSKEDEFDIDGTVRDTCDNGGLLKIRMKRPRKNTIKVLLLMDSGGSMRPHTALCAQLFQAATSSNHLKEVKSYYFHNCVYDAVYETPVQRPSEAMSLDLLLKNYDDGYRVIFVGDAEMDPYELHGLSYSFSVTGYGTSGEKSLKRIKDHFSHVIWLNPVEMPTVLDIGTQTHLEIADMLPMFDLTLEGLEKGLKKLLVRR